MQRALEVAAKQAGGGVTAADIQAAMEPMKDAEYAVVRMHYGGAYFRLATGREGTYRADIAKIMACNILSRQLWVKDVLERLDEASTHNPGDGSLIDDAYALIESLLRDVEG